MTRSCKVCNKVESTDPEVTFHRIPLNPERRKIWFALLDFKPEKVLPKSSYICSDHFERTDFHYKNNGLKYLNSEANPRPVHLEVFQPQLSSNESNSNFVSFSDSSPERKSSFLHDVTLKSLRNTADTSKVSSWSSSTTSSDQISSDIRALTIEEMNLTDNLQVDPSVAGPSGVNLKFPKAVNIEQLSQGSSSTLTASEIEEPSESGSPKMYFTPEPRFKRKLNSKLESAAKKRKHYIGDLNSSDFGTPEKRSKNLLKVKLKIGQQAKKIRVLQTINKKLRSKIKSLNDLVKHMKGKALISESSESSIRASLAGPSLEIFERMLEGPKRQKYNDELKCFALTLAFYSPKAYNFVRQTFNNTLPHIKSLSRWFKSVNGEPGFTSEALSALKLKCEEKADTKILCNLVMDEMSIRKMVEWTGTKFTGHVNIGSNLDSDMLPEAREALVFMLVALNGSWKIPVGYFLLNGITATEKANLVNRCLEFVHETGVIVTSLTCDGAAANIAMMEQLGADFSNPEELKTSFKHPATNNNIFVFLDASHMIKLVRNCLGVSNLQDENEKEIKFEFISKLVELQNKEGLHAATKLKLRHLEWQREKMRVRLATQVLSKSVSDALKFVTEELKLENFENSLPTAEFILKMNNAFDILNSRNYFGKYFFKRPLSPATSKEMFNFIADLKKYIINLKLNGVPVLKSKRKTGFLGLLICMTSLRNIYETYVLENQMLKYILTYKFSQDHLELFFGAIRSKGGFNNNPSARQFEAAYKRLLVHSEVTAPNTGNAVNLEKISILCGGTGAQKVSATDDNSKNLQDTEEYKAFEKKIFKQIQEQKYMTSPTWDLTDYVNDIVGYVAGFVVKRLKKCLTCCKCLSLLESPDISLSRLQQIKTYGALQKASTLVVSVCKVAEKFFRFYSKTNNIFIQGNTLMPYLVTKTLNLMPSGLYEHFGDHLFDDDPIDGHITEVIKLILKNYFKIRIYHELNKKVDVLTSQRIRSINTKTILFKNQ